MDIGMKIIGEIPRLLDGFIQVVQRTLRLPNGEEVVRDIYVKPDGVAVVALTPESEVFLVRQARAGTMNPCSVEIPAGLVESEKHNNDPLIAAMSELREETGCDPAKCQWHSLGTIVPSPGDCTCKVHLYLARNATVQFEQNLDSDEYVQCFTMPFGHAVRLAHDPDSNILNDGPSFTALTRAWLHLWVNNLLYGD